MAGFDRGPSRGTGAAANKRTDRVRRSRHEDLPPEPPQQLRVLEGGGAGSFSNDASGRNDAGIFEDENWDDLGQFDEGLDSQADLQNETGSENAEALLEKAEAVIREQQANLANTERKLARALQIMDGEGSTEFAGKLMYNWYRTVVDAQQSLTEAQEAMNVVIRENPELQDMLQAEAEMAAEMDRIKAERQGSAQVEATEQFEGPQAAFEQGKNAVLAEMQAEIEALRNPSKGMFDIYAVREAVQAQQDVASLGYDGRSWNEAYGDYLRETTERPTEEVDRELDFLNDKIRTLANAGQPVADLVVERDRYLSNKKLVDAGGFSPEASHNSLPLRDVQARRPGAGIDPDQMRRQLNS